MGGFRAISGIKDISSMRGNGEETHYRKCYLLKIGYELVSECVHLHKQSSQNTCPQGVIKGRLVPRKAFKSFVNYSHCKYSSRLSIQR